MASLRAENTDVAIIGAGVAGLTIANIFRRNGVEYSRQRAGTVEARAVRMFHRWGMTRARDREPSELSQAPGVS